VAIAALLSPAAASWWTLHSRAEAAAPSVEILDVGQGDATLVRYARDAILVDGGGSLRDPRFGSRVLIPALVTRGVRRLDAVVLTHPHPDHCVGLIPVMQSLEVGELWISGRHAGESCTARLVDIAFLRGIPVRIAERATPVAIGSIALEPMVPRIRFKRAFLNNTSIVLRVRFGRQSALLTGDIEKDAERTLVEDFGPRLDTDVLKVAHHGSRTSTTSRFLDATSPATAVISCGRDNRFGHPAADVVEELRWRRIRVFRTDRDGSVRLTFRETRVAVGN
jgi:competence protein ComEC